MRNLLSTPARKLVFSVFGGLIVGLAGLLFYISNAASYLSDEPETCVNCHVMIPHYATWQRGSHGRDAVCNDCHVPHDNFVRKYAFKAMDGMRHATVFTLRTEPHAIRIKEAGIVEVQRNCIRCHVEQIRPVSVINVSDKKDIEEGGRLCWDCHENTPHGGALAETSTPLAGISLRDKGKPYIIFDKSDK